MCNPRRVMIHLARCIEEAWRQTIETTASESGEVAELARLGADVPLDAEMGDMALDMLERVLSGEFEGFEPWARDDRGRYCRDLGDVTIVYDPKSRRLNIETQLSEMVSAEARGAAKASGFTVGQVTAEAVGRYYEDGWGGRTEERAMAEAQAEAERKLDQALKALHREQNAPAMEAAEAEAKAEAQERAREALAQAQEEVRAALRERMQATLARAEERVYHVMNRAVGQAYRQTLRRVVRENGGRILKDEETGSVINMELELY
jgi:hypothetical protein